jgi:hypothetical protein
LRVVYIRQCEPGLFVLRVLPAVLALEPGLVQLAVGHAP